MQLEQRSLVQAFASQAALAIERAQFAEHARQLQILQATEKLQSALLNSISHELRTPLVAVTGALSSLKDEHSPLDDAARISVAADGYAEAERLNRLVGNLLGMTRIEAGCCACTVSRATSRRSSAYRWKKSRRNSPVVTSR